MVPSQIGCLLVKKLLAATIAVLALVSGQSALGAGNAEAARFCTKVGVIGDSKSTHRLGAGTEIERRLKQRFIPYYFSAAGRRSIVRPGNTEDFHTGSGLQTVKAAKRAGANCFIIALGGNDAVDTRGDVKEIDRRINAMMRTIGPGYKVDWITSRTSSAKTGPWANSTIQVFSRRIEAARHRFRNLEVNHWERVRETKPGWYRKDGVHLKAGNPARAKYTVDSLFIRGSR